MVIPANLKEATPKIVKPLLSGKLLVEFPAKLDMPVWRRGEDGAHALQITKVGLAAIGIADGPGAEVPAKKAETAQPKSKTAKQAKPPQAKRAKAAKQSRTRSDSKQAKVIAMLQSAKGVTIKAIEKATSWQTHSVRGFLAGVVRKRLKLKLSSAKVDGVRVYRIANQATSKAARKPRRLR